MIVASVTQPDSFTYIEGLQLLIVAIGIAKILAGLGWLLENRYTCKIYWVHALGAVLIGLLLLQYAWTSFFDYTVQNWPFGQFLLECSTPMIYLFVSELLFPDDSSADCNLMETYRKHIGLIAILVMVAQVVNSILDQRLHPHEAHLITQQVIRAVVILVLAALLLPFPRFRRIHEIVFVFRVLTLIIFCILFTPAIQVAVP